MRTAMSGVGASGRIPVGDWLARWAWRRLVAPRAIGYIWLGEFPAYPGEILAPSDVEAVFRGR